MAGGEARPLSLTTLERPALCVADDAEESAVRVVCGGDAGLGIGANTTVFTLINTLILNPLPVPDAANLQAIGSARGKRAAKAGVPLPISFADLKDYQSRNKVFRSLAGYTSPRVVTWQAMALAAHVRRVGDRELLFDTGPASRQGTVLCRKKTRRRPHTR